MTAIDADTGPERVVLEDGGEVDLWTYADDDRVTVTAWMAPGDLVGLAWFDVAPSSHPKEADVEVTPTHRRRGIGTALLRHLVAEAAARRVSTLTWTHPADDPAVTHLEAAAPAPCARRVEHGRVKSTIFVPAA